jgi:hypothetical protein
MKYFGNIKRGWHNNLCFILQPDYGTVMNKKGIERNLVVLLFVLVLIVFSFAERDSKKIEHLYTTAQLLKESTQLLADIAAQVPPAELPNN